MSEPQDPAASSHATLIAEIVWSRARIADLEKNLEMMRELVELMRQELFDRAPVLAGRDAAGLSGRSVAR